MRSFASPPGLVAVTSIRYSPAARPARGRSISLAPPGAVEALQKYLELQPTGPNAASAKEMIAQLGSTVQTTFSDPNKKPEQPKKKK